MIRTVHPNADQWKGASSELEASKSRFLRTVQDQQQLDKQVKDLLLRLERLREDDSPNNGCGASLQPEAQLDGPSQVESAVLHAYIGDEEQDARSAEEAEEEFMASSPPDVPCSRHPFEQHAHNTDAAGNGPPSAQDVEHAKPFADAHTAAGAKEIMASSAPDVPCFRHPFEQHAYDTNAAGNGTASGQDADHAEPSTEYSAFSPGPNPLLSEVFFSPRFGSPEAGQCLSSDQAPAEESPQFNEHDARAAVQTAEEFMVLSAPDVPCFGHPVEEYAHATDAAGNGPANGQDMQHAEPSAEYSVFSPGAHPLLSEAPVSPRLGSPEAGQCLSLGDTPAEESPQTHELANAELSLNLDRLHCGELQVESHDTSTSHTNSQRGLTSTRPYMIDFPGNWHGWTLETSGADLFYFHFERGCSQWHVPAELLAVLGDWTEVLHESGMHYWWNEKLGATSWQDPRSTTNLFQAALLGDLHFVRLFACALGALDARDETGCTALHVACAGGADATVAYLLQCGAGANLPDLSGSTPLHWAVRCGNRNVVDVLVNAGADQDGPDKFGETPRQLAHRLDQGEHHKISESHGESLQGSQHCSSSFSASISQPTILHGASRSPHDTCIGRSPSPFQCDVDRCSESLKDTNVLTLRMRRLAARWLGLDASRATAWDYGHGLPVMDERQATLLGLVKFLQRLTRIVADRAPVKRVRSQCDYDDSCVNHDSCGNPLEV